MKNLKNIFADLGLLYCAIVWGTTFVLVKDSLDEINPLLLVGWRFTIAGVLMAIIALFLRKKIFDNIKEGVILGFFLWMLYAPQTIGLKYTTASNSGFITGLFILFVPIFSFLFFKIIPGKKQLLTVSLALLGLWFITGGLSGINIGDLITLLTAVAYSIHLLFCDKFVRGDLDPYVLSWQQFFFTGIFSFVGCFIFGIKIEMFSKSVLPSIIFLSVFATVAAFLIQLLAQKITKPVKVAVILSLEPVFAAISAWTFGGEEFIIQRAFGGILIVSAMIIAEIPFEKRKLKTKEKTV